MNDRYYWEDFIRDVRSFGLKIGNTYLGKCSTNVDVRENRLGDDRPPLQKARFIANFGVYEYLALLKNQRFVFDHQIFLYKGVGRYYIRHGGVVLTSRQIGSPMANSRIYDYEDIVRSYVELGNARMVSEVLGVPKEIVYRANRLSKGKCANCSTKISPGEVLCKDHKEKGRKQTANWRKERRQLGLCQLCDKPYDLPSRTFCNAHRLSHTKKVTERYNQKFIDNPDEMRRAHKLKVIKSAYGEDAVRCYLESHSRCKSCDRHQDEIDIHIHHIDCDELNHAYSNLVCLCRQCHLIIHSILRATNPTKLFDWLRSTYAEMSDPKSEKINPKNILR